VHQKLSACRDCFVVSCNRHSTACGKVSYSNGKHITIADGQLDLVRMPQTTLDSILGDWLHVGAVSVVCKPMAFKCGFNRKKTLPYFWYCLLYMLIFSLLLHVNHNGHCIQTKINSKYTTTRGSLVYQCRPK